MNCYLSLWLFNLQLLCFHPSKPHGPAPHHWKLICILMPLLLLVPFFCWDRSMAWQCFMGRNCVIPPLTQPWWTGINQIVWFHHGKPLEWAHAARLDIQKSHPFAQWLAWRWAHDISWVNDRLPETLLDSRSSEEKLTALCQDVGTILMRRIHGNCWTLLSPTAGKNFSIIWSSVIQTSILHFLTKWLWTGHPTSLEFGTPSIGWDDGFFSRHLCIAEWMYIKWLLDSK